MIDRYDASYDALRLAVWRGLEQYDTQVLLTLLSEPNTIVRTTAARQLHLRGGADAFSYVLKLARGLRAEDREIAAFVLGQFDTPNCRFADASFPILKDLMSDVEPEVVCAAIGAIGFLASLGKRAPERLTVHLLSFSKRSESSIRTAVATALGFFDDQRISLALQSLRHDKNRRVAAAVRDSLRLIDCRKATKNSLV